ncbi:hypothetical protein LSAT2_020100 [Lamellibrachia satsuma]|nr:hypothetical protein LSAT2_020100 [Lamellibrachia satsuma]
MYFRRFFGKFGRFTITLRRLCVMIVIIGVFSYYHQFINTMQHYDTSVSCLPVEPDVSFNAMSSGIDVGQTELEQYNRYTEIMKKTNDFATYSKYSYKIAIIENRSTTDGIFIRIHEYFNKRSTNGGSSFIISADHIGTEQCPYRDFFNGTYLAWCPSMTVRERRTIVVTLEYVNFAAFDNARPASFGLVQFHTDLRLDKANSNPKVKVDAPIPLRSSSVAEALKTYTRKQDVVLWYKDSDSWKIKLANGEHFWSVSTKRMCDCIKKIRHLIMMGSSHMRYKYAYIAKQCYNRTGVGFSGNIKPITKNIQFAEFLLAENFTKCFRHHLGDIQLGGNDVLLVQTGAHDLARKGLSYFMDSMEKYVDVLVDVRNKTKIRRHNFIVLTPPPFPMHATVTRTKGDRNSFCIAASVRKLKQLLAKHNFEVFDEFSILRPVAERDLCTGHYICPIFNGKSFDVYGDVGFTGVRLMMSHVCTAKKRWLSPSC